ncbi:MAG: L-threonylcarbamoyladenylate synthase [Pseudomonadota bacterium]
MASEKAKAATEYLKADPEGVSRAAALLEAGALVAFPTETVYGLGADATDARAVAGIFEAKGRPRFNPLIAHVPDMESAAAIGHLSPLARRLAERFWPGALTLVVPRASDEVSDLVTAGLDTVALRVPAHPVALELLRAVGRPLAAPSANPSGKLSPTTAADVLAGLGGRIAAVLDGGPTEIGLESTILGVEGDTLRLLRPGGIPVEEIEAAAGVAVEHQRHDGPVTAPGQLESHYAPEAHLRLNAAAPEEGEAWLGFGPDPDAATRAVARLSLSPTGNLREAAAALFKTLRTLDSTSSRIAVAPIPETGLGLAINDRLQRAAAPRDG